VSRPEVYLPVDLRGSLIVDTPSGRSIALRAEGATLRVEVPGWAEVKSAVPSSMRDRRRRLRLVDDTLRVCGLKLILEASGKPFLLLGAETRASWLARLLGLAPADVRLSAVGFLLGRQRS